MGRFQMLWRLGKWSKMLTGFLRGNLRTMRCEKVATGVAVDRCAPVLGTSIFSLSGFGQKFSLPNFFVVVVVVGLVGQLVQERDGSAES